MRILSVVYERLSENRIVDHKPTKMSYLHFINNFWAVYHSLDIHDRPNAYDITFYFYLLYRANRQGLFQRCNGDIIIRIPSKAVEYELHFNRKTLAVCRERLKACKLIDYMYGDRHTSPVYKILSVTVGNANGNANGNHIKDIKDIKDYKEEKDINENAILKKNYLESDEFLEKLEESWKENYRLSRGVDYVVTERDKKALKEIVRKIPIALKEINETDLGAAAENFLAAALEISDTWMQKNMSITLINNKFNEVLNILKNGNYGKQLEQLELARKIKDIYDYININGTI